MSAVRDPFVEQDRLGRPAGRADQVRTRDCALHLVHRLDRNAEARALFAGIAGRAFRAVGPDSHAPDRTDGEHGFQMASGLGARSQDRKIACIFPGKERGRQPACRRCPDCRYFRGIEQCHRLAVRGLEQQDEAEVRRE